MYICIELNLNLVFLFPLKIRRLTVPVSWLIQDFLSQLLSNHCSFGGKLQEIHEKKISDSCYFIEIVLPFFCASILLTCYHKEDPAFCNEALGVVHTGYLLGAPSFAELNKS